MTLVAVGLLICAYLGTALIASAVYAEFVPLPRDGRDEYVPMMVTSNVVGLTALFVAAWVLFA